MAHLALTTLLRGRCVRLFPHLHANRVENQFNTFRVSVPCARAVAPLAAALARHPSVREMAHAALEKLGYTDAGVKK